MKNKVQNNLHSIFIHPTADKEFESSKEGEIPWCTYPTLDSSAILPCPTLSYPILHCILLPSYHILPRPTLDYSAILPYPTQSYTSYPKLHSILPRPTLDSSAILPCPTPHSILPTILPCPTLSYPVLPILPPSYPSYTVFYCHPTTSCGRTG